MLQHQAYTPAGWILVRELPCQITFDGRSPAMAGERKRRLPGGSLKIWSHTRGPKPPGVEPNASSMTIADRWPATGERFGTDVRAGVVDFVDASRDCMRRLSEEGRGPTPSEPGREAAGRAGPALTPASGEASIRIRDGGLEHVRDGGAIR